MVPRKMRHVTVAHLLYVRHYSHACRSGIGLETTILFLREGASVLMTDISEPALSKAITKAKELAPHMTGKVDTMKCDVSKESDVQDVVERVDEWGGVDVMFNNAGIMHGEDDGTSCFLFSRKRELG